MCNLQGTRNQHHALSFSQPFLSFLKSWQHALAVADGVHTAAVEPKPAKLSVAKLHRSALLQKGAPAGTFRTRLKGRVVMAVGVELGKLPVKVSSSRAGTAKTQER